MNSKGLKERLIEFLKTIPNAKGKIGIGQNEFETSVGITTSTISKIKDGISTRTLEKIMNAYPELNTTWLLTGEGEMLKSGNISSHSEVSKDQEVKGHGPPKPDLTSASTNHDRLVRAHELQAEAILSQTRQGESLVETNKILVTMLANSTAQLKSPPIPAFPSFELLEKAANAGLNKHLYWNTVDEGLEVLGKLLIGNYMAKSE